MCPARRSLTHLYADLGLLAQVHLFDLEHMKSRGHFPLSHDTTCISALAFNALGTVLAAATAGGGLLLYQVAGRRLAPWLISNSSTLKERLAALPAAICDLSFSPDPKVPWDYTLDLCPRPVLPFHCPALLRPVLLLTKPVLAMGDRPTPC